MGSAGGPLLTPERVLHGVGGCFVGSGLLVASTGCVLFARGTEGAGQAVLFGLGTGLLGWGAWSWMLRGRARAAAAQNRGEFVRDLFAARTTDSTLALRDGAAGHGRLGLTSDSRRFAPILFGAGFALALLGVPPAVLWPTTGAFEASWLIVLVGMGLAAATWTAHALWTLTAPRPRLELDRSRLERGTRAELRWSYPDGRGPNRLRVRLVERVLSLGNSGRSGSPNLDTDERPAFELFATDRPAQAQDGAATLTVPAEAHPSDERRTAGPWWSRRASRSDGRRAKTTSSGSTEPPARAAALPTRDRRALRGSSLSAPTCRPSARRRAAPASTGST